MIASVTWRPQAVETYHEILNYFEEEGMFKATENFTERVEKKIEAVRKIPGRGRLTSIENIRYILIDKHRRMYYAYDDNNIGILIFFDARQHPSKAPF